MHHQQAAKAGRSVVVQKRYIECTAMVHFCPLNVFTQANA